MILGYDHISFSVCDMTRELEAHAARGYRPVFRADEVENSALKRPLLERYEPWHSLALLAADGQVAVELLRHGEVLGRGRGNLRNRGGYIELATSEVETETAFFSRAFRFRRDGEWLRLPSPVPNWSCTVKIVEEKDFEPCMLDSEGHTSIAFFTTDLDRDLSGCVAAGATFVTGAFDLRPADRPLKVAMMRTAGGSIAELIQVMT